MIRIPGLFFLLGAALGLSGAGCGGGSDVPQLRPFGSPDVVILSVSGHDGTPAPDCEFTTNRAYLGDAGEAVDALADMLAGLGFNGQIGNYASRLESGDLDGDGLPDDDRLGFLELLDDMQFVFDNWIKDFANPTAIIIVAHGHGAVWAHAATRILSEIPVAYLITLDGISDDWECVHRVSVDAYQQANGNPFPFDLSRPGARWTVAGEPALFDTEDVAFDSVIFHLEVRSDDGLDTVDDLRLDGSETDVFRFTATGETHDDIRLATSDAMQWVTDFIAQIEG